MLFKPKAKYLKSLAFYLASPGNETDPDVPFTFTARVEVPESHHKCPVREIVPSLLDNGRVGRLWDVRYELDNPKAIQCPYGNLGNEIEVNGEQFRITSMEIKQEGEIWVWHLTFLPVPLDPETAREHERLRWARYFEECADLQRQSGRRDRSAAFHKAANQLRNNTQE